MPLTLVSIDGDRSTYLDTTTDTEVVYGPGPLAGARPLLTLDDALIEANEHYQRTFRTLHMDEIEDRLIDPTEVDDIDTCQDCSHWLRNGDLWWVNGGSHQVCVPCREDYFPCGKCDDLYHPDDTRAVGDDIVCDRCADLHTSYCDDCEERYWDIDSEQHQHGGASSSCCESPKMNFSIPAPGLAGASSSTEAADVRLPNDMVVEVTTRPGIIHPNTLSNLISKIHYSTEGVWAELGTTTMPPRPDCYYLASAFRSPEQQREIEEWNEARKPYQESMELRNRIAACIYGVGSEWKTERGTYPKRLRSYAHNTFGIKIPKAVLTEIGNLARENSNGLSLNVAITRDLNGPAEDFAHDSSCWWTEYDHSRCTLKSNGGFGLRAFSAITMPDGSTYHSVEGRAWVMPFSFDEDGRLFPALDDDPDAYVVFNEYGDLEERNGARVMAAITGFDYVRFDTRGEGDAWEMYINAGMYLLAPKEIVSEALVRRLPQWLDRHANLSDD